MNGGFFTRGMFDDLQAEAVRPDIRWVALLYGDLPPAAFVHYDQFPVDVFFLDQGSFLVCDTCPAPVAVPGPIVGGGLPGLLLAGLGVLGWRCRVYGNGLKRAVLPRAGRGETESRD